MKINMLLKSRNKMLLLINMCNNLKSWTQNRRREPMLLKQKLTKKGRRTPMLLMLLLRLQILLLKRH